MTKPWCSNKVANFRGRRHRAVNLFRDHLAKWKK